MKINSFRTKLHEARVAKKLSQLDVALELNISRSTLSDWENGKTDIKVEDVIKLARMYEDPEVYTLYIGVELQADDFIPIKYSSDTKDLRILGLEIQNEHNDVVEEIPKLMRIYRDGVIDEEERPIYQNALLQIKEFIAVMYPVMILDEMQRKKALQDGNLVRAHA